MIPTEPVPPPFLPFSQVWQYWLFYLFVSWVVVWGGHFLLRGRRLGAGVRSWPWPRLVGLVLVLFPFVRLAYSFVLSIPDVTATGTVAPTRSAASFWLQVRRGMLVSFVVPLVGLFLASGQAGRLADGARVAGARWRATLAGVGLWPRHSWIRDGATGLGLAVIVFFGYVGLQYLLFPLRQYDTGDASAVFLQITVPLAFALALMAGLTEELLFRGILVVKLRALLPGLPVALVVVFAALVFGLAHAGYGTIGNMVFPFLFGLATGILAVWVGVWPLVIVHAFVNLMIFLSILAGQGDPAAPRLLLGSFLVAILVPALYFGTLLLRRWTRPRQGGAVAAPAAAGSRPPAPPVRDVGPSRPVPLRRGAGRNA